jgi:hypothetical protein
MCARAQTIAGSGKTIDSSLPACSLVQDGNFNPGEHSMNIIIWLAVGGIIGWLASIFMKTDGQQGIILYRGGHARWLVPQPPDWRGYDQSK